MDKSVAGAYRRIREIQLRTVHTREDEELLNRLEGNILVSKILSDISKKYPNFNYLPDILSSILGASRYAIDIGKDKDFIADKERRLKKIDDAANLLGTIFDAISTQAQHADYLQYDELEVQKILEAKASLDWMRPWLLRNRIEPF